METKISAPHAPRVGTHTSLNLNADSLLNAAFGVRASSSRHENTLPLQPFAKQRREHDGRLQHRCLLRPDFVASPRQLRSSDDPGER